MNTILPIQRNAPVQTGDVYNGKRIIQYTCEAESKGKHGVWDPMPGLTVTSPYADSNTCNMGNPMPESSLSPSQGIRIWPQYNMFEREVPNSQVPSHRTKINKAGSRGPKL